MRALPTDLRRQLESAVVAGRHAAEAGVRAAFSALGVKERDKPAHLSEAQARLRRGLRAKQRQLGGEYDVLVWDAAYEQWHRLLFARFLAENGLLRHPEFDAPVTLAECEELSDELGEPDGWSVAARFAAEILPGIFRLDDPCVQLRLAPEHRIAMERIVAGLPAAVFAADDSLGWVYQYWQSERKNQVNASEVKIGGADLGPVTQLFTENYMVRFLLENSLGAWWAARHPDSPLVREFEFLRFDDDGRPAAGRFDRWPDRVAEVTVMDPCCGSGHFLVVAFWMLWHMLAEEEGLDPVAAQDAVLRDNLFGLELDPRCVQIAMFAVALTAWKQGGGWRELPTPNIACSGIPAKAPMEEWSALAEGDERLKQSLERLYRLFKDADTLGSLIHPRRAAESANGSKAQHSLDDVGFDEVAPLLETVAARETPDPATAVFGAAAASTARSAELLQNQYTLVVTNPPYLGTNSFSRTLRDFTERYHSAAKHDLATVVADRTASLVATGGAYALVLPESWRFKPRLTAFRRNILARRRISALALLGEGAFASGAAAGAFINLTIIENSRPADSVTYFGLDATAANGPEAKAHSIRSAEASRFAQEAQLHHPDARILLDELPKIPLLKEHADSRFGLRTGDSPRLIRKFWEFGRISRAWQFHQSAPASVTPFGGRENVLLWEGGSGTLKELADVGIASIQGADAWGKQGAAVKLMRGLEVTRYTGESFDNNCAVVWPENEAELPALWWFLASPEFHERVREIDTNKSVTNKTLLKVPFDIERWRTIARERGPLPEPFSDDPTQWLFEGRPDIATDPLQVAVGRLVGYRWPKQPVSDELSDLADGDGIVCLPAVGGEQPAANRLQVLLARAYGDRATGGRQRCCVSCSRIADRRRRHSRIGCAMTSSAITAASSHTVPSFGTSGMGARTDSRHW